MPQPKSVRSLKTICLQNIAKHMDKLWCKDYLENYVGQGQFLYVNGPFDCLPGSLVNDIIQTLKNDQMLRRHHLHLLITSNLKRLDLAKETSDMSSVLNLISFRCKYILKELILSHCIKIPKVSLKDTLSCLENLEVLDLSWTNVTDDVLGTLGGCCTKLRDLNVTASPQVTDKGIKYLCIDEISGDSSASNGKFGKCKRLSRLQIQDTRVGLLGVEAALRNLPNLTLLSHPEVVAALESMHGSDWEAGLPLPKYCLRSLFADNRLGGASTSNKSLHQSLSLAAELCPHTSDVHLLAYRYSDCPDALLSLCKLRQLKVLHIMVDDSGFEDCSGRVLPTGKKDLFSNAIIPVLQTCGQFITTLSLGEVPPNVDIGVIGLCCPALSDLNLAFNKGYTKRICEENPHLSTGRKRFQCLKKLTLVCICCYVIIFKDLRRQNQVEDGVDWPKTDLPVPHLKDLLSSPVLETIFIRESSTLTDSLLREVLAEGQKFVNLREMELEQCHNVTSHFIYSLLNLSGPLKSLKVWECKQITHSDFNSFKSLTRKHKWDLSIDWM